MATQTLTRPAPHTAIGERDDPYGATAARHPERRPDAPAQPVEIEWDQMHSDGARITAQ